jgi:tRNA pseudouridine55 synthase
MTQTRIPRRPIDGVLLLDKPLGLSSNAALQQARRIYRAKKAGHTGTLDPLATGLLPLCFGEATKFAQSLLDAAKRYTATIRFGVTTVTGDAEGSVVETRPVNVSIEALQRALQSFTGRISQIPPVYSALKFEGRAHYDYARAGIEVPRVARTVEIFSLRLLDWNPPDAVVDVECSKGTYIRVLAEDLGIHLECGAHLAALRRTATGGFKLDDAVTLPALEAMDDGARLARLLGPDAPLAALLRIDLEACAERALVAGQRPFCKVTDGRYRAYGASGRFLGMVDAEACVLRSVRLTIEASHDVRAPQEAPE